MGTGDIALPTLRSLLAHPDHRVVGLVTQPDKPVGRKQVITAPEIKRLAEREGLTVFQPTRVRKAEALKTIADWQADLIVVMAYGQILPKALLEMPPLACLNLHASLLPRHRGAAPIQAAIRDGDPQSGITAMYMDEGLDTGDILLKKGFDLSADETGGSLHDRLADLAPGALLEALAQLQAGTAPRIPQDEGLATHTGKLTREDGVIDWKQPADVIERMIRAFHPWPGTVTGLDGAEEGTQRRLKIFPPCRVLAEKGETMAPGNIQAVDDDAWRVTTGQGFLEISQIQLEGKRRMSVREFEKGRRLSPGACLR